MTTQKSCAGCGQPLTVTGNRQSYCGACAQAHRLAAKRAYSRRYYAEHRPARPAKARTLPPLSALDKEDAPGWTQGRCREHYDLNRPNATRCPRPGCDLCGQPICKGDEFHADGKGYRHARCEQKAHRLNALKQLTPVYWHATMGAM